MYAIACLYWESPRFIIFRRNQQQQRDVHGLPSLYHSMQYGNRSVRETSVASVMGHYTSHIVVGSVPPYRSHWRRNMWGDIGRRQSVSQVWEHVTGISFGCWQEQTLGERTQTIILHSASALLANTSLHQHAILKLCKMYQKQSRRIGSKLPG